MDDSNRARNDEGRDLWNQKAAFWDELHGDQGNRFHRELVAPAVERLLAIQPGERVLDVACGSGVVARRLAELGAHVTATDFSAALIEKARQRPSAGEPIRYLVVDATDEAALVALGQFDALVCTMALMDIPDIMPLYRAATRLLQPSGRFVIVTAHPAFNSSNPTLVQEVEYLNMDMASLTALKISAYLDIPPVKSMGAPGEPTPHYYYHRPLHQLLGAAFAAGFVLDALEEPAFPPSGADPARPLSWISLTQFPPVMAARLRRNSL